jgi:hypothetical protein
MLEPVAHLHEPQREKRYYQRWWRSRRLGEKTGISMDYLVYKLIAVAVVGILVAVFGKEKMVALDNSLFRIVSRLVLWTCILILVIAAVVIVFAVVAAFNKPSPRQPLNLRTSEPKTSTTLVVPDAIAPTAPIINGGVPDLATLLPGEWVRQISEADGTSIFVTLKYTNAGTFTALATGDVPTESGLKQRTTIAFVGTYETAGDHINHVYTQISVLRVARVLGDGTTSEFGDDIRREIQNSWDAAVKEDPTENWKVVSRSAEKIIADEVDNGADTAERVVLMRKP